MRWFDGLPRRSLLLLGLCLFACSEERSDGPAPKGTGNAAGESGAGGGGSAAGESGAGGSGATHGSPLEAEGRNETSLHFVDEAAARGVTGPNHCGSAEHKRYLLEEMGSGCALFDADGDGDQDLYVVDACSLLEAEKPGEDLRPALDGRARLYRNDGAGRFTDVSDVSPTAFRGYGQGVAVADVDNDGDPDLYVTCWGENLLYRNEGGDDESRRFTEVGAAAGVADPSWSVGSTFFDADRDGDLDLYVANYFAMAVARDPECWSKVGCPYQNVLAACGPKGMVAEPDRLYQNRGDGTFADVSGTSGIRDVDARYGLGVVSFDYDTDGDVDVYVANDSRGNFLFQNDGAGSFEDVADFEGCVLSHSGVPQAGMGIACGDYDGDLAPDLFLTNFSHDYNTLYRNGGSTGFLDVTRTAGFSESDYFTLGWGAEFVDLDNDGDRDLLFCNGHVYPEADQCSQELSFRQQNRLYERRDGAWLDVTLRAGPGLAKRASTRGMAAGDVDGDGDLDLVLTELGEAPTLLLNQSKGVGHYLRVVLVGTKDNRGGIGARLDLEAGGRVQRFEMRSGHSYASCHENVAHFGLGAAERAEKLVVVWPSGAVQEFTDLAADHVIRVRQGRDSIEVLR